MATMRTHRRTEPELKLTALTQTIRNPFSPRHKERRHEKEADVRGRDPRRRSSYHCGLRPASGDEYRSGPRALPARVHQGRRSDPAHELALMDLRGIAIQVRRSEQTEVKSATITHSVHTTR